MKRFLVSLTAVGVLLGSSAPAFARVIDTPRVGDRPAVKMHKRSDTMSVRKGDKRVKVIRSTRRNTKMQTRARWTPKDESSMSSSSSSSSSAASSVSSSAASSEASSASSN